MNYSEVVDTIEHQRRFGRATGREVSAEMLRRLGSPERGMRIVHIAGTNGKGSTAAMITSVLAHAGFRTGLFTSPHLIRFNERIQIAAPADSLPSHPEDAGHTTHVDDAVTLTQIPDRDVAEIGTRLLQLPMDLTPTMFDYCLAMALLWYQKAGCDYVVLETGLGGLYDSTSAVTEVPLVSVITSIGFDHMAVLGNTLAEIAASKAGIIRAGTRCVVAPMDCEAGDVILSACEKLAVPCAAIDDPLAVLSRYGLTPDDLALRGTYQMENASGAICAVEQLADTVRERHADEADRMLAAIPAALRHTFWPGRMQTVTWRNIPILLDGAHNPQGVSALAKSIAHIFPGRKCTMIAGVLADKDYESMMEEMIPLADHFYTVTVENSRALMGESLAEFIRVHGVPADACTSIGEALARVEERGSKAPVVAFGSLYFIGELEAML